MQAVADNQVPIAGDRQSLPGAPSLLWRVAGPAAWLVLCAFGTLLAVLILFTQFSPYDDEGWLMFTVHRMLDGRSLYGDVKVQYGPIYYLTRWVLFSFLQLPLTNDVVRLVTLGTWVSSAALLSLSWIRMAGWRVGLALVLPTFMLLSALAYEPGHPQEVYALVLAITIFSMTWNTAAPSSRRLGFLWLVLGLALGAMALIKINLGLFFGLAVLGSFLVVVPWARYAHVALVLYGLAGLALPALLMKSRLSEGWLPTAVTLTLAMLPVYVGLFWIRQTSDKRTSALWLAWPIGAAISVGLGLLFTAWQGNTLAELVHALIVRPGQQFGRGQWGWPYPHNAWALAASVIHAIVGSVLLTLLARQDQLHSSWRTRVQSCIQLVRVVAVILFTLLIINLLQHWTLGILAFAWVALAKPSSDQPWNLTTVTQRSFIAVLGVIMHLQTYPVPGSQIGMALIAFVPVMALIMRDLLQDDSWASPDFLPPQFRTWARPAHLRMLRASIIPAMLICVLALVYLNVLRLSRDMESRVSMDLPGCRYTFVPPAQAIASRFLAVNLHHWGDSFLARQGMNSLHGWAMLPVIADRPIGNSWSILDDDDDRALMQAYGDRTNLIFVLTPSTFQQDRQLPDMALSRHVQGNFVRVATAGSTHLLQHKNRLNPITRTDMRSCAWVVSADAIPGQPLLRLVTIEVDLPQSTPVALVSRIVLKDLANQKTFASTQALANQEGWMTAGAPASPQVAPNSQNPAASHAAGRLGPSTRLKLQAILSDDPTRMTNPALLFERPDGSFIEGVPVLKFAPPK